jgi:hypothetical protein
MTDSVPVASLVGPYCDDVLALAAIIREVDGSNRMGPAGLAEAILSHPAWPALAEQFHPQEPTQPAPAIGPEWQPCVKLPITVHVREQRPGERHISTREGITPVRPDDLIMRGVKGEEYPIGREVFNRTYRMGEATPAPASDTPESPDPIAEVLPASGEDWAAVVRKAAQPDGHEARVMLEIQQRLVAVEGPVVKAKPEPEPVERPASPWGPWRPMDEAPKDGTQVLAHDLNGSMHITFYGPRDVGLWILKGGVHNVFWLPLAWMPLPDAPKKP